MVGSSWAPMRLAANGATIRCHGRPEKNVLVPPVIAAGRVASRHFCRARRWQPTIVGTSGEDLNACRDRERSRAGDDRCRATLARYIDRLARGLAMVINLIDPDAIVLGGGLSQIGLLYREVPQQSGAGTSFPTGLTPGCSRRPMAMRAGCAERLGYGRQRLRLDNAVPRLQRAVRTTPPSGRCGRCASPRLISHSALAELTIAHIDCDAFFATVEKRDRPELADRPVIGGGGKRGVVLACCYVARLYGVRSAMPMFQALAACPVGRSDPSRHGKISQCRQGGTRRNETTYPLRGADLDRRSVSRSIGNPSASRRGPGANAGKPRPPGRGDARHQPFDRAQRQQISSEDRVRSRQAARLRGVEPR